MNKRIRGYIIRFALLHILTYMVVGMIFYQASGYDEALNTMEAFKLYRSMENPIMAAAVFLGQIVRGVILALLIYPFYNTFLKKRYGWVLLFSLVWGLTALGSLTFIPNLLEGITQMSLIEFIESLKIGVPEITVQMIFFSLLLFSWEKRKSKKAV